MQEINSFRIWTARNRAAKAERAGRTLSAARGWGLAAILGERLDEARRAGTVRQTWCRGCGVCPCTKEVQDSCYR